MSSKSKGVGEMAKILVDKERCKGCKMCIAICPKKVLTLSTELNPAGSRYAIQTEEEECIGCRLCGMICPDSAVSIYAERRINLPRSKT